MNKYKAIIFDYDGVIINSFDYHLKQYKKMFPNSGLTAKELADVHNGNFLERNNNVWSKIDVEKYDKFLSTDIVNANLLFPGIKNLLNDLDDVKKYIVTSGSESPLNHVLENENIKKCFAGVYGKETDFSKVVKLKKVINDNNYSADDILFITDTLGDVLEANKAGIRSVAVTYGFHTRENLQRGNPWKIVDSLSELREILLEKKEF